MLPGVHFVRPDVGLAGGITQVKKIAAIAESLHQRLIPHNFLGPVTTMACVQLAASTPNWDLQEYFREEGTPRADAATNTVEIVDGYMKIPDEPGLGIDLDIDGIKRHPYDPRIGRISRRGQAPRRFRYPALAPGKPPIRRKTPYRERQNSRRDTPPGDIQ